MSATEEHIEVEGHLGVCQRIITAYRHEYRRRGHELRTAVIASISNAVPNSLIELATLGRTLKTQTRRIPTAYWPISTARHLQRANRGDQGA